MASHLYAQLLPYFAFLLNLSLLINGNKYSNEVDMAFGIYYSETKPAPVVDAGNVIQFLDELTDVLTISADKTRIAVVEFGTKEKVLLTLKNGVYPSRVLNAIERIGEGSYTGPREVQLGIDAATTRIRELAFVDKWDRPHVPKLAVLVVDYDVGDSKSALYPIARALGNAVMIVPFAYDNDGMKVFAPANNIRTYATGYFQYGSVIRKANISHVDAAESFALETNYDINTRCNQTKWIGEGCHFDFNERCAADVFYRIDGSSNPPGSYTESLSELAHLYCKKNGSTIPCPQGSSVCEGPLKQCQELGYWGKCNASCDSRTPGIGYNKFIPNNNTIGSGNCSTMLPCRKACPIVSKADILEASMQDAMIGMGVALGVIVILDVFIVLYILKLTKEDATLRKLAAQAASAQPPSARTEKSAVLSSASHRPDSLAHPPTITSTPQSELIKQYAAKRSEKQ